MEVRKRNEDALSRVLGDFAVAKAAGKLEVDEDEDDIEGVEGEDWVWWRADNVETASSSPPVTTATNASASSSTAAAASSAAASAPYPSPLPAPSTAQQPARPALKRPARAPLLKVPPQPLGQPTSKFARKAPGSSTPPPLSQ
ncbi:hypothetical protein HXX76_005173 [Chlamydomonas incerta]|uniref:Uncharacterized protein n=1 Tax=Chlamydomonas incerta TaxID=51695 RepID=A0A835W436_CHLIN|nr:hypothetical protein HXX76_005173 [Chlamydomonas incerta]|eukprot:KAG2438625.1 hypothetical protein HXX76_005173 [Chlamydomonas incerta]